MRFKTYLRLSSITSCVVLACLFAFQVIMTGMGERWADQSVELHLYQKIAYGVAIFWSRFWWLAFPFVIAAVFLAMAVIRLLLGGFAKKEIENA